MCNEELGWKWDEHDMKHHTIKEGDMIPIGNVLEVIIERVNTVCSSYDVSDVVRAWMSITISVDVFQKVVSKRYQHIHRDTLNRMINKQLGVFNNE